MKTFNEIITDDSMRSTLPYGTSSFRFDSGVDNLNPNHCVDWHWHHPFEFSLVVSGKANCLIGNQSVTLTAGNGIFINSGVIHSFTAPVHATLVHIFFAPEFIASDTSDLYIQYVQPILSSDMSWFSLQRENDDGFRLCGMIDEICGSLDDSVDPLLLYIQVLTMWRLFFHHVEPMLSRSGKSSPEKMTQVRLKKMLDYIHCEYGSHISLCDIAGVANISQSEASRCFRAGVQTSPINYLNNYRLDKAKELLQTTYNSITEIALSVGFDNVGYFGKAFRKKFHHTPKEMRMASKAFSQVSLLPVAAVIMASGHSTRFGSNKLMAELNNMPMICHTFEHIPKNCFSQVIVVARSEEILDIAKTYGYTTVHNSDNNNDTAVTIRLGLQNLSEECSGCAFLVADQPFLKPESLQRLVQLFQKNPDHICAMSFQGQTGNPVLFPRALFGQLSSLQSHQTGRVILNRNKELLLTCDVGEALELKDIDTQSDMPV